MKRIIITIAALLAFGGAALAQAPQGFSYQAVIRDHSSALVKEQLVGVQIQLRQGSSEGTVVYTETFEVSTNSNGLLTLRIGSGTSKDNFGAIDWSQGPYFIETSSDLSGGNQLSADRKCSTHERALRTIRRKLWRNECSKQKCSGIKYPGCRSGHKGTH